MYGGFVSVFSEWGMTPSILGAEVDDSWRGSFAKWFYLAAKPSHMGVGSMWMGWPALCTGLRLVTARRGDMSYLPGVVLSCRYSRRWCLSGDVKLLGCRYLMES
jgi:hypothetical protein